MSLLFLCSYGIMAQTAKKVNYKSVEYKSNVDAPLTTKERKMITDVYGIDAAQKYIFNKPQRLKDTKNLLRNRVQIIELSNKNLDDLTNLSEIPLFDTYQNIERDKIVDKNNFNPLKYSFNFYGKDTQYVRVDNTQLVIIITSQFK